VLDHFPREDVILLNSNAGGNEHPITTEFVRWYSKNVHPVVEVNAIIADLGGVGTHSGKTKQRREQYCDDDLMSFVDLATVKGRFPSRKAQFCTEYLKLAPQRRWIKENVTDLGHDIIRYSGVRRDESQQRKNTPDYKWDDYFDCYICYPIASWTKKQCFDFVKSRGERFNELYLLGFSRVGCAPCINSSKEDISQWGARFPEMIDKVRAWEQQVGRTFFAPCVPGKAINWVDEVVAWAKTTRGGKQIALPFAEAEAAAGLCSSKYGLCE
jgi:3'-phosphoadenosine 5'-phosphosulfate sulfotransferase (PAPS reductase)/FAD synthetase